MFKLITDVPAPILEFFVEEIRTELTGSQVEQSFTYLDENMVEQTGIRMVNQYIDNAYVVLLDRGQSVSWEQVQNVTEKHAGKRDNVIDTFISLAMVTDTWEFFDEYTLWLEACEVVELYNSTEQFDSEGEPITFEPVELPTEPLHVVSSKHDMARLFNAKLKRNAGHYDFITLDTLVFDADPVSYEKMKGTLLSWDALNTAGVIEEDKILWTLADNTNALLTQNQLMQVIDLIAVRAAVLQSNYEKAKL